jgi:hypothetical protein
MKVLKLKGTLTAQLMQGLRQNRLLFTNTGSLVIATGLTSVVGFAYWWAAARLFTPEMVGLASALISAMTLIGTISVLGFRTLLTGELALHPGRSCGRMHRHRVRGFSSVDHRAVSAGTSVS